MKLLLVDGHYYAYRSFYAIAGLTNSKGEPTNAIYGFAKALRRMLADVRPDRAAVVFDGGLPALRMELLPQYKQNRSEMPAEMAAQLPVIDRVTELLGFPRIEVEGQEADDVIASYALTAKAAGWETVIATNDKDIMQLVDDRLTIYSPGKDGQFALIGPEGVREKWGVVPAQIADVLALTGDSSDNIPGIPGVGPKTAAALIQQFGSVEALLERPEQIAKDKLRAAIQAGLDQIRINRQMVSLFTTLPLPAPAESFQVTPRYPELIEEFRRLEFKGLTKEIEKEAAQFASFAQPNEGTPSPAQGELF
ncbi:5'-3' exonuclease H3TH domain-containing protein [Oscillatoria amoena NRMC-F 0135]|nr:5'-3' exonuclease H3TH domain-containing protein [Oscillatoria amoena NRMC-F 0135]